MKYKRKLNNIEYGTLADKLIDKTTAAFSKSSTVVKDVKNAAEYSYKDGVMLPPAGHLRVTVTGDSVKVEYVAASLQDNKNGSISDSYLINKK
jgi:hypothetical protein